MNMPPLDLGQPDDISVQDWPNLRLGDFEPTSDPSYDYNCAAWALSRTDQQVWPWPDFPYVWPPGAPMEETLDAFKVAYELEGFQECADDSLEENIERIVIYVDADGVPTHVARQLLDGRWTSKLGDLRDIDHASLEVIAGGLYGHPQLFMRRVRDT